MKNKLEKLIEKTVLNQLQEETRQIPAIEAIPQEPMQFAQTSSLSRSIQIAHFSNQANEYAQRTLLALYKALEEARKSDDKVSYGHLKRAMKHLEETKGILVAVKRAIRKSG